MAFYTSRVDDDGNELERRESARSNTYVTIAPLTGGSTRITSRSTNDATKSSVRYINRAAFIEHNSAHSDADIESANTVGPQSTTTGVNSAVSEGRSNLVPPLDLQSEENFPTTRDYTFSYRKHCGQAKIVLKPDMAYETWLSAKRKLLSDEALRRKRAEEQKRKVQEERKHVAEEKYKQWLETKSRTQVRPLERLSAAMAQQSDPRIPKTQFSEEALARRDVWERTKRIADERRRMQKRQQEEQQRALEEQRRQLAAEAWEKWLADAASKPKPVPLNRGIFTLRGTVSDIYVNPNEWKTVNAEDVN